MKKVTKLIVGCSIILLASCQQSEDLYQEGSKMDGVETSDFNFSTASDVNLKVTYNTKVAVPFSVYAENPVTVTTNEDGIPVSSFNSDIQPLYCGYTSTDGTFNDSIELPAYAKSLYIVSPAFYVQNVLEANVSNGSATATETTSTSAAKSTRTETGSTQTAELQTDDSFVKEWKTLLGTFDSKTGAVSYTATKDNTNSGLFFTDTEVANIFSSIPSIFSVYKDCPEEFLVSKDITVPQDEEISITMLGGNTCWNSSLGYYYYTGEKAPENPTVIALFPNTQDGKWTNGASGPTGINRNEVVFLKYYGPNYDQSGTTTFPKDTKIGFVLACNAWTGSNNANNRNGSQKFYSYTTPGRSSENSYAKKEIVNDYHKVNTAMVNYDDKGTVVAFEDHYDDHNCSDVLFALKPQFNDINTIPEIKTETTSNIFCFEDLWPDEGDYDMNDVIIYNDYTKSYETKSTSNEQHIIKEDFVFTTDQNHSNRTMLNDGLAAWIEGKNFTCTVSAKAPGETTYTVLEKGKDYKTESDKTKTYFYLTSNVKTEIGTSYKITLSYKYVDKRESETGHGCFLYRNDGGNKGIWEVHIPYEEPTSNLNGYYQASIKKDAPYAATTKEDNTFFPFAIKLTGATKDNISKLLEAGNETIRIDKLYPGFNTWSQSKGKKDTEWYKQK